MTKLVIISEEHKKGIAFIGYWPQLIWIHGADKHDADKWNLGISALAKYYVDCRKLLCRHLTRFIEE